MTKNVTTAGLRKTMISYKFIKIFFFAILFSPLINYTLAEEAEVKQISEFTSSNLPIIIIETNGDTIVDEPKISAFMGIINNGPDNRNNITDPYTDYSGIIGIEARGNSTQYLFPKTPYAFETRDSLGENLNVSLLGMPEENDWILLASYIDRTFIRDPLAHYLSSLMGGWSSRSRFCELVINGEYRGIYILIEKIKRDDNRLDIKKLEEDDTTSTKITGGYIYEVTGFDNDFGENRKLHYPDLDDITEQQLEYIKGYDDDFRYAMVYAVYEHAVYGFSNWIDVDSFIDEMIIQEFMKNSDAYGWSSYFHKNRGEKLKAGPVWDFDQSSGNSSHLDGGNITGWIVGQSDSQPEFWSGLFNNKRFKDEMIIRWNELREDKFKDENIIAFIDSCADYLEEAQERNFELWPTLGVFLWRETEGYQDRDTYQKEVDYLKDYMVERAAWMDGQLQLESTSAEPAENEIPYTFNLEQNYPNPFNPSTTIKYSLSENTYVTLKIFNILGQEVDILVNKFQTAGNYSLNYSGDHLNSGLYFYSLTAGKNAQTKKMILLK